MKEMKKKENLTERDWEELASIFSGEKEGNYPESLNGDFHEAEKVWRSLGNIEDEKHIDTDKAWNRVQSRISENHEEADRPEISLFRRNSFLRIAAAVLLILSFGAITVFVARSGRFSKEIIALSGNDQRNLKIGLPDGSTIFLNRNSELRYRSDFGRFSRAVKLKGEAFFEIAPDTEKPFTIDAGKALVKVVGTSFSVLTENQNSEVEVFVRTGRVLLSEKSGGKSIELDPGFIGKTEPGNIERSLNNDPNYLAWNTGKLFYDGEKLGNVFSDLKKFYNMDIIADDPAINDLPWTSPIEYISQDKIILLICRSFNLSYSKDGETYHLSGK